MKEIEALGFAFSKACALLDDGIDPRTYEMPLLVKEWDHAQTRSSFDIQHGGDHYKAMGIQPVEYMLSNPQIGYCEGNAIKYLSRWKDKGGIEDLRKARHYIDMLIEHEVKE